MKKVYPIIFIFLSLLACSLTNDCLLGHYRTETCTDTRLESEICWEEEVYDEFWEEYIVEEDCIEEWETYEYECDKFICDRYCEKGQNCPERPEITN